MKTKTVALWLVLALTGQYSLAQNGKKTAPPPPPPPIEVSRAEAPPPPPPPPPAPKASMKHPPAPPTPPKPPAKKTHKQTQRQQQYLPYNDTKFTPHKP